MKVSARNVFAGKIAGISVGAVNAEITLSLQGNAQLVAVITNDSVKTLELAVGKDASALVKASSIIIATGLNDAKVSARNIFTGKITRLVEGPVNTEVDLEIAAGNTVSAVITSGSAKTLGLTTGGIASAIIKASNVIIAVE